MGQPLHGHCLHARAAHPPGDRTRFEERSAGRIGVAGLHQREGQRPSFLRVLGALRHIGQELGGSDIAREGDRAVEHHRVVAGLLQGHAPGTCNLTGVGERHLRPFEGVQELGGIAGPTARPGEPLEVIGSERLIGVGVAQRGPRRGPLALVVCGSGVVQERFTRGHAASLSFRTLRATLPSASSVSRLRLRRGQSHRLRNVFDVTVADRWDELPRQVRIAVGILVALFVWTLCAYVLPHLPLPTSDRCAYYDADWNPRDAVLRDVPGRALTVGECHTPLVRCVENFLRLGLHSSADRTSVRISLPLVISNLIRAGRCMWTLNASWGWCEPSLRSMSRPVVTR